MIKKNFKGRCRKRMVRKCKDVVRTYNAIQEAYVDVLEDIRGKDCPVDRRGSEGMGGKKP